MCVWEKTTESPKLHYHSSLCACVWYHTPPTYLNVHYHTETHFSDSCHHYIFPICHPGQPTISLSLFIILSKSRTHLHKAGFELQSCKVNMWWEQSCTGQVKTLWDSFSVFLGSEKLISCRLKVFLCERGNTHWSMEDQFVCVVRTSHSHPPDIPLPVSNTLSATWAVKMCLRMKTRICN